MAGARGQNVPYGRAALRRACFDEIDSPGKAIMKETMTKVLFVLGTRSRWYGREAFPVDHASRTR